MGGDRRVRILEMGRIFHDWIVESKSSDGVHLFIFPKIGRNCCVVCTKSPSKSPHFLCKSTKCAKTQKFFLTSAKRCAKMYSSKQKPLAVSLISRVRKSPCKSRTFRSRQTVCDFAKQGHGAHLAKRDITEKRFLRMPIELLMILLTIGSLVAICIIAGIEHIVTTLINRRKGWY